MLQVGHSATDARSDPVGYGGTTPEHQPMTELTANDQRCISALFRTNPAAAAALEFDLSRIDQEREMQVTRKGEILTFISNLTDQEAINALAAMRSSFAQSLFRSRQRLSDNQMRWVHFLSRVR